MNGNEKVDKHINKDTLNLFLEIYSLPKFGDLIKDTPPDSSEREEKIKEFKIKFYDLYQKTNLEEFMLEDNLDVFRYNKSLDKLKNKVIDIIKETYPEDYPTFMLINDIYSMTDVSNARMCDQLLTDMVNKSKEDSIKKGVKDILNQMFQKYDEDKDGEIGLEELQKNINKMGLPTIMANEIMLKADILKDNKISYSEFEKYCENQIMKFYKVFYNLDSDEDGKLNYKQARQTLHEIYPNMDLTDDVYKNLFITMDQDQSGLISFDEWCQFLFLFPQQNIDYMVNQHKLYAMVNLHPQEISTALVEQDILMKNGQIKNKYIEILKTFLCGGVAGGVSRTVTAPLDQVRTLFQTMYINSKPPNVLKGILDIYHDKGIQGLYRGNSLSIVMSVLEQAMRFVIIENSKKLCENEMGHINPHVFLYIGIITTVFSTLFLFPLELVRIRVISSEEKNHKVINKFKKIYSNNGIKGFYTGFPAHMISVLPAGSFNVFFYNLLRKIIISESDAENAKVHKFMFVGGTAALITGTVTYPMTLLTTRLIVANREITDQKQRVGLMRMIGFTISQEGLFGFYKGYKASMIRLIMGQSCNFGTYETLKSIFKVNSRKNKK